MLKPRIMRIFSGVKLFWLLQGVVRVRVCCCTPMRILLKVGPILQADESNCSPSKTTEKKAKKVAYLLG